MMTLPWETMTAKVQTAHVYARNCGDRLGRQAIEYVRREWVWARTIDCYLREVWSVIKHSPQTASF